MISSRIISTYSGRPHNSRKAKWRFWSGVSLGFVWGGFWPHNLWLMGGGKPNTQDRLDNKRICPILGFRGGFQHVLEKSCLSTVNQYMEAFQVVSSALTDLISGSSLHASMSKLTARYKRSVRVSRARPFFISVRYISLPVY